MSALEVRVKQAIGIADKQPIAHWKWPRVSRHYQQCIDRGMSLNRAVDLVLEDMEGRAWHRGSKRRKRNAIAANKHEVKS